MPSKIAFWVSSKESETFLRRTTTAGKKSTIFVGPSPVAMAGRGNREWTNTRRWQLWLSLTGKGHNGRDAPTTNSLYFDYTPTTTFYFRHSTTKLENQDPYW
jgi:hypothetical protein